MLLHEVLFGYEIHMETRRLNTTLSVLTCERRTVQNQHTFLLQADFYDLRLEMSVTLTIKTKA